MREGKPQPGKDNAVTPHHQLTPSLPPIPLPNHPQPRNPEPQDHPAAPQPQTPNPKPQTPNPKPLFYLIFIRNHPII